MWLTTGRWGRGGGGVKGERDAVTERPREQLLRRPSSSQTSAAHSRLGECGSGTGGRGVWVESTAFI